MIRNFLKVIILFEMFGLISCNRYSRVSDSEKESLEKHLWSDSKMSLDNIKNYKLNLVIKTTSTSSLHETNKTDDTAFVLGQNSLFFSSTKDNNFYSDGKYFFFYYPNNKSMYGESSKDKTMVYYNNVIQVLKYCKNNMISFSVDSSMSFNTIIINLPENNDLNCNKINIMVSNVKEEFKIKNINFFTHSKRANQIRTFEGSIDIRGYCFNSNKCIGAANLSPHNFYKESFGSILLEGKYSAYKLEKFWQW